MTETQIVLRPGITAHGLYAEDDGRCLHVRIMGADLGGEIERTIDLILTPNDVNRVAELAAITLPEEERF